MNQDKDEYEEEYVDVRSLPLRPPQPLVQPEKAVRRPWHPVMYNHTTSAIATKDQDENDENDVTKYIFNKGCCIINYDNVQVMDQCFWGPSIN